MISKYKFYIKQSWQLLRNEKLFSAIYIVGTGLAITIIMVLSINLYIKLANIYPENDRDKYLFVKSATVQSLKVDETSSAPLSEQFYTTILQNLENVEAISHYQNEDVYLQSTDGKEQIPASLKWVNTGFWDVFSFRFLKGKAFTPADQQSGIATAVITRFTARRLFGNEDAAIGKEISVNFKSYRICGIVKDPSPLCMNSYAQVYVPYTCNPAEQATTFIHSSGMLGNLKFILKVHTPGDKAAVKAQILENVQRYNLSQKEYELRLNGQPDEQWQTIFRKWSNVAPNFPQEFARLGIIYLIFLLIPAISLSGMADSRMERRLEELALRRTFGATRKDILWQIISENLLFTLFGGIVGIICSWSIFYFCREWISTFLESQSFTSVLPDGEEFMLTSDMLFNGWIFVITLAICLILNLLSSLLPAWKYSRKPIIDSLTIKE